jgi:hypothetical protein
MYDNLKQYMYNTQYTCRYNSPDVFLETDIVTEKEKEIIRNILYKEDLLNIFDIDDCCEETMNKIILDIYDRIHDHEGLKECMNQVSSNFSITLEQEVGFILLFSFDYLYLTHICICEFIENGKISDNSLSNLKKCVFL